MHASYGKSSFSISQPAAYIFFYWFYHSTKMLKLERPFWRTLGLLVPILNVYLVWKLFTDIKKVAESAAVPAYPYPGLLTLAFIILSALYHLPGLWSFTGFFSVLPILMVQQTFNRYWLKEQPGAPLKTHLSGLEWLFASIGALLLILACVGAGH